MPLRNDRRAAVYRRLWGWPLRSPIHLVTAVAAATVLALGLGSAATLLHGPPRSVSAPPHPHVPARPAPAPVPAPPPVPAAALDAATDFGQRWTHHENLSGPQLVAALQPVAMPDYVSELSDMDPSRIPDTQLAGPPSPVRSDGPGTAEVDLPTNAQILHLAMVQTPQGWRLDHLREGEGD